jgi:CP family cyanate transporter-like MFS transporter
MGHPGPGRNARRWIRIRIVLVAVNLRVAIVCVGPVLPAIISDLDLGRAAGGLVLGLPLLAFAVVSPFAPLFAERVGIDRCVFVTLLALAAGTVIRSLTFPHAIWVGTLLIGASVAVLNVLLPPIVSRDMKAENSSMTAFYTAAQGVATAVGVGVVLPLSLVLPGGWRTAVAIWALLAVVAAVVWRFSSRGSDDTSSTPQGEVLSEGPPGGSRGARKRIWTSPIAWVVTAFMGLQSLAFYVYTTWVPSYQVESGVPEVVSGTVTMFFFVASVTSSLITGRILGWMRDQRPLAVCSSILITATFVGLILAPEWSLLWSLSGGAACGSLMVIALSLIAYRTVDFGLATHLSAMSQSVGYGVAAVGPVLFGALLDWTHVWSIPLALMAAAMVLMALIGWAAGTNRTIR